MLGARPALDGTSGSMVGGEERVGRSHSVPDPRGQGKDFSGKGCGQRCHYSWGSKKSDLKPNQTKPGPGMQLSGHCVLSVHVAKSLISSTAKENKNRPKEKKQTPLRSQVTSVRRL